jgi:hypothetical protein
LPAIGPIGARFRDPFAGKRDMSRSDTRGDENWVVSDGGPQSVLVARETDGKLGPVN